MFQSEDNSFAPTLENQSELRAAMAEFATGVTVVTAMTETGPIGMTANSFATISLDPPLILWSPARKSQRFKFFAEAEHFAVHILEKAQRGLADAFARRGDAFDVAEWEASHNNVPLFKGSLARFECSTQSLHDAGDHLIILGRVERVEHNSGTPLIFAQRSYGSHSPD